MRIDLEQLRNRLPEQRWFGGKGRPLASVEVIDHAILDDGPPSLALGIFRVNYEDGDSQLYHLPLLVEEDGSSRDALDDVDRLKLLGELMAHGDSVKGERGVFNFGGPGLDPLSPPGAGSARVLQAEQSNTSLVLDDSIIIKLFRRVDYGSNPDLELTRFLTNEAFSHIPPHLGEVVYEGDELQDEPVQIDIAIAQRFIPDAREGWVETLNHLRGLYDAVDPADVAEDLRFLTEERAARSLKWMGELGDVTASMHVALAREEADPEFGAEAIDESDLEEWAERARASLKTLQARRLPEIAALDPLAPRIEAGIDRLKGLTERGSKTRIHGDYHLGQVIRSPRGWMILDFEGEPVRTLDERVAKQSALRDVAGMLRSLNYAAYAALFERGDPGSDEWARLEPWARTWEDLAREKLLSSYLTRSHEGRFLPTEREDLMTMLEVFEIDKALYELGYEIGHRPTWIRIPLEGIAKVIERGESS